MFPMSSSTSEATIGKLRVTFASHSLPATLVSDNGACFTSEEFQEYQVSITHLTSASYHPSSNGLVERAVQTLKKTNRRKCGNKSCTRKLRMHLDLVQLNGRNRVHRMQTVVVGRGVRRGCRRGSEHAAPGRPS